MIIDVVTIFPKMFAPVINESIIKRAQNKGLVKINIHDLREFAAGRQKKVDAPSYGGGGMVFKPEPVFKAIESIKGAKRVILFSPRGKTLNQKRVKKFLNFDRLVLICPRYEGVDERIRKVVDEEISLGDYILSGAELAGMVFIDCVSRLIPGVVSDKESIENESFQKPCLDFPHYTRPQSFKGFKVPKVLLSGDHKKIAQWRKNKSLEITKTNRPDLLNET